MSVWQYIKDKVYFLVMKILLTAILLIYMKNYLNIGSFVWIFFAQVLAVFLLISFFEIIYDIIIKYGFYRKVWKTIQAYDKKTYAVKQFRKPEFYEGKLLIDAMEALSDCFNEQTISLEHEMDEYKEYIESWVHEIKLPITSALLICNETKSPQLREVEDELRKIDNYVEQVMYYARSSYVEKDYHIKEISVEEVVKKTLKKYAKELISAKAQIHLDGLEKKIYSDEKWLIFILGQLITNSLKYKKDVLQLSFKATEQYGNVILEICDNGCGISQKDISRIFDKGFTGENGRRYGESTGIGLYLCKQLCRKLNVEICAESEKGQFTNISLVFPKMQSD